MAQISSPRDTTMVHASPQYLDFVKLKPDFLTIFTHITPFQDGLRESGGMTTIDYTRLRMTCRTVAESYKPFPHNATKPDSHLSEPYFAGLKSESVRCDDMGCRNTSDIVAVRPCYGRKHPLAGIYCGCNKNVCIRCAQRAQRAFDHHQQVETELHVCFPCAQMAGATSPSEDETELCKCGLTGKNMLDEPADTDFQCMPCRSTYFRVDTMMASNNLRCLEDNDRLRARDRWCHVGGGMSGNLHRWIHPGAANRNNCPGCGCNYRRIVASYPASALNEDGVLTGVVRQCAICLKQRPGPRTRDDPFY